MNARIPWIVGMLLIVGSLVCVPNALASHKPVDCEGHGDDVDGDGICGVDDVDRDNDGIRNSCDPHPDDATDVGRTYDNLLVYIWWGHRHCHNYVSTLVA